MGSQHVGILNARAGLNDHTVYDLIILIFFFNIM